MTESFLIFCGAATDQQVEAALPHADPTESALQGIVRRHP